MQICFLAIRYKHKTLSKYANLEKLCRKKTKYSTFISINNHGKREHTIFFIVVKFIEQNNLKDTKKIFHILMSALFNSINESIEWERNENTIRIHLYSYNIQ
uniref:Uncharacterized protein n=1 Tax=Ascaris lumbricoides TaxID=6252 RepID=A0A0M3IHC0_ASCLU